MYKQMVTAIPCTLIINAWKALEVKNTTYATIKEKLASIAERIPEANTLILVRQLLALCHSVNRLVQQADAQTREKVSWADVKDSLSRLVITEPFKAGITFFLKY